LRLGRILASGPCTASSRKLVMPCRRSFAFFSSSHPRGATQLEGPQCPQLLLSTLATLNCDLAVPIVRPEARVANHSHLSSEENTAYHAPVTFLSVSPRWHSSRCSSRCSPIHRLSTICDGFSSHNGVLALCKPSDTAAAEDDTTGCSCIPAIRYLSR
jgi:hypothetical protein